MTSNGGLEIGPRELRVILSSPGDVATERDIFVHVISEVNALIRRFRWNVYIASSIWETEVQPGYDPAGPQAIIDRELDVPNADLVVGVFWKRFGTPTPTGETGSERELRAAMKALAEHGKPEVILYFRKAPVMPNSVDEVEQMLKVLRFREEVGPHHLVREYSTPGEFGRKLNNDLLRAAYASNIGEAPLFEYAADAVPVTFRDGDLAALANDIRVHFKPLSVSVEAALDIRAHFTAVVTNRFIRPFETDAIASIEHHTESGIESIEVNGRVVGGASLLFPAVPIHIDASGIGIVRLRNIRLCAPAASTTAVLVPVSCYVDVRRSLSGALQQPESPEVHLGPPMPCFDISVRDAGGQTNSPFPFRIPANETDVERSLTFHVIFKELIVGAFRSRAQEAGGSGYAASGTQLISRFTNVPPGIRISVSTANSDRTGESDPPRALLRLDDSQAAGPDRMTASQDLALVEIRREYETFKAVWEWVDDQQSSGLRNVEFTVKLTVGGASVREMSTFHMDHPVMYVVSTLGPISTEIRPGSNVVPRFNIAPRLQEAVLFIPEIIAAS